MKDEKKSKAQLIEELKALRRRIGRLEAVAGGHSTAMEMVASLCRPANLKEALGSLRPHDHLCVIYESPREWREAVVPFVAVGLKRGEKCVNIADVGLAYKLRQQLCDEGIDVADAEASGRLSTLCEYGALPQGGFDLDRMIGTLIAETDRAFAQGYPLVRVTAEIGWALRCHSGLGKFLEYESRLDRDFFRRYPCISLCQYDRWKLTPEIVKDVVTAHPLLVRGNRLQRNFYYTPPDDLTIKERDQSEVQHWLDNIEREWQIQEAIRRLAYHDSLTGLPNRLLFNDYLTRALNHARYEHNRLAMMLLDLDGLKRINDTLGHSIGDRLLQAVGVRLRSILRDGDIVGRMGGDEFMLLLPEVAREDDAVKVAQRVLEAFRRPFVFDDREVGVTASIGIAVYPGDGEDADTLMKNADLAMYWAKQKGRDDYECYAAGMDDRALL